MATFEGWIYIVGTNVLGLQYCKSRFMRIQGRTIAMFKRDPTHFPQEPVRVGMVGRTMVAKDMGRGIYKDKVLYILRLYDKVHPKYEGLFGCTSAEGASQWLSAFEHAKAEAEKYLSRRDGNNHSAPEDDEQFRMTGKRNKPPTMETSKDANVDSGAVPHSGELTAGGKSLQRIVSIGKERTEVSEGVGSTSSSDLGMMEDAALSAKAIQSDLADAYAWRVFRVENGLRFFEDVEHAKENKTAIVKAVGVVAASSDAIFEAIMTSNPATRYQWDQISGDVRCIEHVDGHLDVMYTSINPKYYKKWHSPRDMVTARYWRRDSSGAYTIASLATTHVNAPEYPTHERMTANPGSWEIVPLGRSKSQVTQYMELTSTGWSKWKPTEFGRFHVTIPYFLLSRIAGLREFFAARPDLASGSISIRHSEIAPSLGEGDSRLFDLTSVGEPSGDEAEDDEEEDEEFYDAAPSIGDMVRQSDSPPSRLLRKKSSIAKPTKAPPLASDLQEDVQPVVVEERNFQGNMAREGWSQPEISQLTQQNRRSKPTTVDVGEPLLKLLAVDCYKHEGKLDAFATTPGCIVQSPEGKRLPFILVVNLQIPGKPRNYSVIAYLVAPKPIRPRSLLDKFVNGSDSFRDASFKLLPAVVKGYWIVKRAVGKTVVTVAQSLSCNYIRGPNFLEIDIDIGSSSVARGMMSLVLKFIASLVIDLAIFIEPPPEEWGRADNYLLGAMRVNHLKPDNAVLVGK
eukprot:SM000115S23923  [mRNA]  locus=s115:187998:194068:- [translate_table: standard]